MKDLLQVKNLSFCYDEYDIKTSLPTEGQRGIHDISFCIPEGSFVTLCGSTGSGKSTLLKLIKKDVITAGRKSGEILLDGVNINEIPADKLSSDIGLLFQNPEDQIVTDKVWHEIAFGLENLGIPQEEMATRIAESLAFFRLEGISRNDTASLSGGQKQLVSLASVLAMYPRLLLLDEPTSQLDPEAAEHYISTLKKLQSSLGLTVIIAEHNLDRLLPISDMLMVMDEGSLVCCDTTASALNQIFSIPENSSEVSFTSDQGKRIISDFPLVTRLCHKLSADKHKAASDSLPLSASEGRQFLKKHFENTSAPSANKHTTLIESKEKLTSVLSLKNVCFRYHSTSPDIINELSANFSKGKIYALLGCNASGKSTLLNLLSGNLKPQLGKISPKPQALNIAYMPQDIDNMFIADSIEKELSAVGLKPADYPDYLRNLDIKRSPFDLSGGEKQLLALAKIEARKADIILLDEPTKGTDNLCRIAIIKLLRALSESGTTVIMACHDMNFAAEISDFCAILSMGRLTEFKSSHDFFIHNLLYTTSMRTLTRGIIDDIYLESELLK